MYSYENFRGEKKAQKTKNKKQIPRSQNQIIDLINCSEFTFATAAAEVGKCHQVE